MSDLNQHTLDLTTRLDITFRPTVSLQLYTQPFIATGDFHRFKGLARASSLDYVVFGDGNASTMGCFDARDIGIACDRQSSVAYYVADADGAGPLASVRITNRDFDARSLNGNAVLRWEYRPGSAMYFVWSTNCAAGTSDPRFSAGDAVKRLCAGRSNNVFAIKANYWLSL